jgi:hypothetical protein
MVISGQKVTGAKSRKNQSIGCSFDSNILEIKSGKLL